MKSDVKVEIKKLQIKIGDKDLSLSMEEAQKLYGALGELFKAQVVEVIRERPYYWPYPHYRYDYTGTSPLWPLSTTTFTCDVAANNVCMNVT